MKLRIGICLRIMFAGGVALAGLGLAGCSHSPDIETPEGSSVRAFTPQAPPFLAGPVAVLLTNMGGFSARVTIGNGGESAAEAPSGNEPPRPRTGQLLVAGTHLLFAPDPLPQKKKQPPSGGFTFIRDVASGNGYVLSESLQGYAPSSSTLRATNIITRPGSGVPEIVDGHLCVGEQVTVEMNDGLASTFEVWRAKDLHGVPMKIKPAATTSLPTLTLSKVRMEMPTSNLFGPPSGFTKFNSPEIMVDELAMRHRNLRRAQPEEKEPLYRPQGAANH